MRHSHLAAPLLRVRVKTLRRAVRVDNFRLAQRLRMGLVLYLKHLEEPLRNDVARLFEVSGLWVRNVGHRRQTERNVQRIIRRIINTSRGKLIERVKLTTA